MMLAVRTIIVLLMSCAWSSLAHSATAPSAQLEAIDLDDVGAPAFSNFSARDGLPDAVTVAVCTDRDGFVWAASPVGVFRYDGHRWIRSDDPAMANAVDDLWLDHAGTLWAALRTKGLARYDGARWHVEDLRTGLPSQQIRRFAETREADGTFTLWALTWDRGLLVRRNGRWIPDPDNASAPSGALLSLAETQALGGQRRLWLGTGSNGLWYRDEGSQGWRQWHAEHLDSAQIEHLLVSSAEGQEELWMSVFGVGLYRLTDAGLRQWSKERGELPTNEIYNTAVQALADGERVIWAASRFGLLRLHKDHVQAFDRAHGLPSDVIRGLNLWRSPSGESVIWLATEVGISRTVLGASAWSTASLMGARSIGVFGVLVEPDGDGGERLWVGASDEGLGIYEQDRWRYYSAANGALPSPSVSMIAVTTDAAGARTHWLGMRGGELVRVRMRDRKAPLFETQRTPWQKTNGEGVLDTLVRTFDGREEQWIATRQAGAYRLRDGKWSAPRPEGAHGEWRVAKFQEQIDASGRSWLWASTNRGLARFDGQHWRLFGRSDGLPDENLLGMNLHRNAERRAILWIGTASAGIVRVDATDPRDPAVLTDTLPPPPDPTTYDALRDSRGRIYICTNNGVQQLTPEATGYASRVFMRRDGMIHDECNGNARFIDAHDRYWVGTLGGLTVHDPQRESGDLQPKPLRITSVLIDGKPLKDTQSSPPGLNVAAGAKAIEIGFSLLSWYREDESRFRTQLVGFENVPGEWTSKTSRTFNTLPPGHYDLRIEARDYAGNLSQPIDAPIAIGAHWWQHVWVRAAAGFTLLLLGYAALQWRTRSLQAQRRALEGRVAARTIELDAANARLLQLSYHDELTGLANRRRLLERLGQLEHAATNALAGPSRQALIFIDVDHFKACNDRFGHLAGDDVLRAVADAMRRCVPVDALIARYGGEEFACLLPGADSAQALAVAECLRAAVAACEIPVPGAAQTMNVTISAGVASVVLDRTYVTPHLVRDADMALYRAKRDGRNRVCVHDEAPVLPVA